MIYNVALVFDAEVGKNIYGFYEKCLGGLDFEFNLKEDSICHATVLKFQSDELSGEELEELVNGFGEIEADFSGITFLPSHSGKGCWVEISILKNRRLLEIQDKLISRIGGEVKSGVGDRFRPHVTFGKLKDCKIRVDDLDYLVLRMKGIKARLAVGTADEDFEFYEL